MAILRKNLTWAEVKAALANDGKAYTRKGWSHNKRRIYYVPPGRYPAATLSAQAMHGVGIPFPHVSYIALLDDDNKNENDEEVTAFYRENPVDSAARDWYEFDAADFRTLPSPLPL